MSYQKSQSERKEKVTISSFNENKIFQSKIFTTVKYVIFYDVSFFYKYLNESFIIFKFV